MNHVDFLTTQKKILKEFGQDVHNYRKLGKAVTLSPLLIII